MAEQVDLELVRQMAALTAQIHAGASLGETLQAVADGVVDCLGFVAAAVNFVEQDGDLTVMAVTGPPDACQALLGVRLTESVVESLIERSEAWDGLAFISHEQQVDGRGTWIPSTLPPADDEAWHPGDALLAPLRTPGGDLVGLLSVDLQSGSRRPSAVVCELLEAFAMSAAVAIDRVQLLEKLQTEQQQLQASEQAFRFAFSFSAGPMATLSLAADTLGQLREANEAFCASLRLSLEDVPKASWFDFVVPDEVGDARKALESFASGRLATQHRERLMIRSDNSRLWASLTSTVVNAPTGYPPFLLVHLQDVTERRNREHALLRASTQDPLTGLANRRSLDQHLQNALSVYYAGGPGGVVLYGDLDRFKRVNDGYGHSAGDAVLRRVAQRLLLAVRVGDLVARVGGDEFVIVGHGLTLTEGRGLAQRIQNDLASEDQDFGEPVTISLGVADFNVASDVAGIIDRADLDMYSNKQGGRLE